MTELVGLGVDVNFVGSGGVTALMCAVQNGHTETAVELIRLGADVTAMDSRDRDVLHPYYIRRNEEMAAAMRGAIQRRREGVVAAVAEFLPIPLVPEEVADYDSGEDFRGRTGPGGR